MKPPRSSGSLSRRRKRECFTLVPRCAGQENCNASCGSIDLNSPCFRIHPWVLGSRSGKNCFFQRRRNDEATVFLDWYRILRVRHQWPCSRRFAMPLADPLGLLLRLKLLSRQWKEHGSEELGSGQRPVEPIKIWTMPLSLVCCRTGR